MKKLSIVLLLAVIAGVSVSGEDAVQLRFRYTEGDRYRILSSVQQNVFVNGRFSHTAEILNRIQITVAETRDNSGRVEVDYESGEMMDFAPGVYQRQNHYTAEFWRNELGEYTIDEGYFVPVVRDVPIWPQEPVEPGDTWARDGHEVHDFRDPFGIEDPYRFPMPVQYRYVGPQRIEDRVYDHIEIDYTIFHRSRRRTQSQYPAVVSGYSSQQLFFDREAGRPAFYEEEYDLEVRMNDGTVFRFAGTADARVIDSQELDRAAVRESLNRELRERDVQDASVEEHERGVTIRLSDIRFPPDSAELVPSEQEKIREIGEILQEYPEYDVLVSGHTALAGTQEGRERLSEARAAAVGRYLNELGVRETDQLLYEGLGAREPVASNETSEGRRQNRRVELTIIDE